MKLKYTWLFSHSTGGFSWRSEVYNRKTKEIVAIAVAKTKTGAMKRAKKIARALHDSETGPKP